MMDANATSSVELGVEVELMPLSPVILRLSLIMSLAILGNVLLVFVIRRGNAVARQRASPVQLLLLHTCLADLLFALLSVGTQIIMLITYPFFYGPDLLCRLVRYLQALPMYANPFLLVAISIDRYQVSDLHATFYPKVAVCLILLWAICRPLVHYRSDRFRRPNCLGLVAWLLALLCSVPQLFFWRKDSLLGHSPPVADGDDGPTQECHTIYSSIYNSVALDPWLCIYVVWFSTVSWLLPSILSAFFYVRVCHAVWKSRFWGRSGEDILPCREAGNAPTMSASIPFDEGHKLSVPSCQLTRDYVEGLRKSSAGFRNQMSEFDRKRIQTVRLTLTIVICNFFLWFFPFGLPFCAINVIQAFWGLRLLSQDVIVCVVILGNLNACVNPWIYILWNPKQTRQAFFSLLRKETELIATSTSATRQTSIGLRMTVNPSSIR